jgi:hypothetical protein
LRSAHDITERTVELHMSHVFMKLDLISDRWSGSPGAVPAPRYVDVGRVDE